MNPGAGKSPGWFQRHRSEILRGSVLGLVAGVVVCLLAWEPCPAPATGESEARVLQRWGPPDEVVERRAPGVSEGPPALKRLVYHCGLFNTTLAVVYLDGRGNVIDVAHGVP